MTRGYRFLEHMTDAFIEASGSTREEAFENAALALVDTMVVLEKVEALLEITISADGRDLETLLFNWLDKILLLVLVDRFVIRRTKLRISSNDMGFLVEAVAFGEHFDIKKHGYKVEIKAVTFHEMKITETAKNVTLKFMLDL